MTLTIVRNPNGFHLIDAMPKEEKYSAHYDVNNTLMPTCHRLIPAGKRKLAIHGHNSRCHSAKSALDFVSQRKVGFSRIPHIAQI
jgi:hypothetical protein